MKTKSFTGTGSLMKLALRRDRVRLFSWVLGIGLLTLLIAMAYSEFSSQEMTEMISMASLSQGLRLLVSPVASRHVGQLGTFFMFRTSFLISILVAMMNTQIVIRHTRQNEESGCAEMVSSTVVGRHASLAASLLTALIANVALMMLIFLSFIAMDLSVAGSLAAATGFAGLGLVYAGFAAVTAQLSESSRGASGMASVVLAITFLINGLANVLGIVHDQALGFSSHGLAWLSPIGWLQQMHAFGANRFQVLPLFAALLLLLSLASLILSSRRDIGHGLMPAAKGPSQASRWLLSPLGLVWRLQRKALIGWSVAMVTVGIIFGAVSQEYQTVIEDIDVFNQFLLSSEYFIFSMIAIVAAVLAIYPMQTILKMRCEEKDGPLESVLSTPVRRMSMLFSYVILSILGSLWLLVLFSASTAMAAQATLGELLEYLKAAMQHGSAMFALIGLVVLLYAAWPRMARSLAWLLVMLAIIVGPLLGPMLNLPERLMNASPFSHIALLPDETTVMAVVLLAGIGTVLTGVGAAAFKQRCMKF